MSLASVTDGNPKAELLQEMLTHFDGCGVESVEQLIELVVKVNDEVRSSIRVYTAVVGQSNTTTEAVGLA